MMAQSVKVYSVFDKILVLFVFINYFSESLEINKCCGKNQIFNDYLECVDMNTTLSRNISLGEKYEGDKNDVKFIYGNIPCMPKDSVPRTHIWYNVSNEGVLKVFNDFHKVGNISKSLYCLELLESYDEINEVAITCPCSEYVCVKKCCFSGNDMYQIVTGTITSCVVRESTEIDGDWNPFSLNGSKFYKDQFYETLYANLECGSKYRLPLSGKYDIQDDGSILSEFDGLIKPNDYCGDYLYFGNSSEKVIHIIACVDDDGDLSPLEKVIFLSLNVIGVLCLIITIILYLLLPELNNLNGKCLICHVFCLTLGHLLVIPNRFMRMSRGSVDCISIGYLMQFSFLASFFWLNVICIDMSYTFSSIRPVSKATRKQDEKRKFLWYSLYSWGGAVVFLLTALIVDVLPQVPANSPFKPNLGEVKCWFQSWQSLFLFFYGPMGVLLLVNLVLFIYTTWRIVVLSRGTDMLRHSDSGRHGGPSNKDKKRYILYVKMFSLMGITWLMEIVSQIVGGPAYYWYFTDIINILRAVFIFIIFCWKPRVLKVFKRKYSTIKVSVLKKVGIKDVQKEEQIPEDSDESTNNTDPSSNKNAEPAVEMKATITN